MPENHEMLRQSLLTDLTALHDNLALFPVLRIVALWNFSNCMRLCIVANLYDVVHVL
jgi:hypothetical protein